MMKKWQMLAILGFAVASCGKYDHANTIDPDYQGVKYRHLDLVDYTVKIAGTGDTKPSDGVSKGLYAVYVTVLNRGNVISKQSYGTVSTNGDPYIDITDGGTVYFDDMLPNQASNGQIGSATFRKARTEIRVRDDTPIGHKISMIYSFSDESGFVSSDTIALEVQEPDDIFDVIDYRLYPVDSSSAKIHYWMDMDIRNTGTTDYQLYCTLSSMDPYITLTMAQRAKFVIGRLSQATGTPSHDIWLAATAPRPYTTKLFLHLEDLYTSNTWDDSLHVVFK